MPDVTAPVPSPADVLLREGICWLVGAPDRCYGCDTRITSHEGGGLLDARTHRWFCGECMIQLLSWEFDGCPDDLDLPFREWIADV